MNMQKITMLKICVLGVLIVLGSFASVMYALAYAENGKSSTQTP
jgi:hypothetical protein